MNANEIAGLIKKYEGWYNMDYQPNSELDYKIAILKTLECIIKDIDKLKNDAQSKNN